MKTSTGFGYAPQSDGTIATLGATIEDVSLMVQSCPSGVQVKAAGGVKTQYSFGNEGLGLPYWHFIH